MFFFVKWKVATIIILPIMIKVIMGSITIGINPTDRAIRLGRKERNIPACRPSNAVVMNREALTMGPEINWLPNKGAITAIAVKDKRQANALSFWEYKIFVHIFSMKLKVQLIESLLFENPACPRKSRHDPSHYAKNPDFGLY